MKITPQEIFDALPKIRNAQLNSSGGFKHSVIIPYATYSPWFDDSIFFAIYNLVPSHTLVDIYRSYELWSLSGQLAAQEGDILDVGSRRHGTGCLMAFRVQSLRSKARVYLCDSLSGGAGEMDAPADSVGVIGELARRLELDNIEILHGRFPDDNARQLADRRFSLCHIDVDDYDFARGVTDWVWPRLCVGGSVVYDDYGFAGCDGITRLVNESIPKEGAIALHNLNGHAVFIKIVA